MGDKGINNTIRDADTWIERGDNASKLEKWDESLECYRRAIEINPRHAFAYFKRGNVYLSIEKYNEALGDLNNAIVLNSNFSFAYFKRGLIHTELRYFKKSIDDFSKVVGCSQYCNAYSAHHTSFQRAEHFFFYENLSFNLFRMMFSFDVD